MASFLESAVEILQGELTTCEHRSDESGRWLQWVFFTKCATTIAHTAEARQSLKTAAAGCFDDANWFSIDRHIWAQSKLPWLTIPESVAVYQQGVVTNN